MAERTEFRETVAEDRLERETVPVEVLEAVREQRHFLARVYGIAASALALSALVAVWAAHRPEMFEYVHEHATSFQALFFFEVASVAVISRYAERMTIGMAWATLMGYAILNGISFCVFFLLLPPGSIAFGFFISAMTFASMSAYAIRFPDRDLRGLSGMFKSLLMGLVIVVVTNLLAGNSMAYWATSYLGVMIFASLTSYHSDFIADLEYEFEDDNRTREKGAVIGALVIFLDFVNLYLLLMSALSIVVSKAEEED
jgi:uncharacterized protein